MKQKIKIKTPPRGGDAAAAWDHNLKPDEKEELARQYREIEEGKLKRGKNAVLMIAAVNAAMAAVSIFTDFNTVIFCIRMLMSIILYLGRVPGTKALFPIGAVACVALMAGVWMNPAGSVAFNVVFSAVDSVFLVISAIIFLANESISEYLYSKSAR